MTLSHGIDEGSRNKVKSIGYKFFTGFPSKLTDGMRGFDRLLIYSNRTELHRHLPTQR
jgi:hypothetical protein